MPTYEITTTATFSAAHAILIQGVREPLHGHDWTTTIRVQAPTLDDEGLLLDFHALHASLLKVIAPFQNANLNDTPPFTTVNPTAERVIEHIATEIAKDLPAGVSLSWCDITEAPGCIARYHP